MLEFDDIQAYILTGYGHLPLSDFIFFTIEDAEKARKWLANIEPLVTHARKRTPNERKPTTTVNVAFSSLGLTALGITPETINAFPREFNGGENYVGPANPMAIHSSSELLQDWKSSAPEHWSFGGPSTPPVHLLLLLFGIDDPALHALRRTVLGTEDNGVREVYRQRSDRTGEKESFGFHDGISQPGIKGSYIPLKPGQTEVAPGEFILGYTDEYDALPPSPTIPAAADPQDTLPSLDSGAKDFGRNGTYLAVRKLKQNVEEFWNFCAEKTKNEDGSENPDKKTWLASKMIGRWPSGAPMALAPDQDDPELGRDPKRNNNFLYSDDPQGLKCPMGSHLRRGNPRDDLAPDNPKTSAKVTARHRIIRRGRPYNNDAGNEQGLMFMAVNADIQRQFEFIMQTWINSPKFGLMTQNKDPILSDPELINPLPQPKSGCPVTSANSVMDVPATPVRERYSGLQRFVDVQGGGYFFMPGLRALKYLTSDFKNSSQQPETPSSNPSMSSNNSIIKNLWQDIVGVERHIHDDFLNLREALSTKLEHMMGNPHLVRPLFNFLREHDPIFATSKVAAVSKYADVVEVLGKSECFSVVDIYAEKMKETTGIFVLGMDDTERYQREIGWMRQATKAEDIDRLRTFSSDLTREQIDLASATGRIDLVVALSRRIPTRIVGDYFGAPGPDEATTQRWMRAIFREIFLDLGNDPSFGQEARTAGKELADYLDSVIAERVTQRENGETLPDDFLSRLVQMQANDAALTNETINRLVGGTIVGTVPTNNKAIAQSLEQLLKKPDALGLTREAAQNQDMDLVTQCVFEALRFNPQNPVLLRHCVKDCEVASGTSRATTLKAGSLVVVGTESAMFDEDKFPQPNDFIADRPLEDYIHFGHGLHTCFGKHIGTMLWPTVLSQVVQLNNLKPASGSDGEIQWDGAFPDHWELTFDAK